MLPKSQLISLSAVPGMGPRRIRALFRKYPDLDGVTQLSKSDLMQVEGISSDLAGKTQNIDLDIEKRAAEWGLTMNAYLNRLVREDFELELRKNTSFIEKVNRQIAG